MVLSDVPEKIFEIAGSIVGLSCSALIAVQIHAELEKARPTSLSFTYVFGYALIFLFWVLYGIRFRRVAMWLTNGVAALLQAVLLIIVLLK